MSRTFHLLTELDSFSQRSHEDLARWVANVIEADKDTTVLAPSSDGTWSSDPNRVRTVKGLTTYRAIYQAAGSFLPRPMLTPYLKRILTIALHDLQPGDTVWIHNRPEFALALAPFIKQTGARVFLHLHSRQLLLAYEGILKQLQVDCYVFNSSLVEQEALQKFPILGKTAVMSSGLDSREFHPSAKRAIISRSPGYKVERANVVFSAYLARENDLQVFLEAMAILKARQVPVSATIIGGPKSTKQAEIPTQLNRRLKIPLNVSFEDFDSPAALGKKLRASEMFCAPSSWHKSASLYMLEALACGLPVIATEGGPFPEENAGAPGILVVPNAAERLAQTIQGLVEDSSARQNLANLAYTTYTTKFMWFSIRASYRSILAAPTLSRLRETQLGAELLHA